MTHAVRFVAVVAVLTALAVGAPVQVQTPEIDALRVRAEAGDAEAQFSLGFMYPNGVGGMGCIWQVTDIQLGSQVALKRLRICVIPYVVRIEQVIQLSSEHGG
jgi:hypothetical protein